MQMSLGQIAIEDIELNPDSCDDIPAILFGLQAIYSDAALKQRIFELLTKHNRSLGPGQPKLFKQIRQQAAQGRLQI